MKRELKICFGAIFALLFIISSFSFISLSFKVIADDAYMENLQELSYTTTVNGEDITIKYRLWIPEDYDASVSYPMITMLHGHGGQGTDNTTQINVFKPLLTKLTTIEQQATNPCIMLIPQCRLNHKWVEVSTWTGHYSIETFDISPDLQAVVNLQDEIMSAYNVDEDRQYVTGHSMGGLATWDLISRFPTRYAAAMPIAGAGNDLEAAANITSVNVWAFHGSDDVVVRPEVSKDMVNAIHAAGGWAKYTEYEGVNHSSGTYTYQNESDVVNFFMSSRRGVKNAYVDEGIGTSTSDVVGSDTFWFYNSAPAYNSSAARDWNYIHYASFNALSVNFHSTDTTTGLKNIKFNLLSSTDMTSDKAIRIRIQTLVPAIANEALRIDLVGSTTKYMNAGTTTTLYLIENSGTTNITATGSGTGAAANVVSGASTANPKLINGYLIIPISVWGDLSGVNYLNIRTNKIYAKNIWNFGDIDYGTYSNGTFTKGKSLWTAFNASGNANGYVVDEGVDAVIVAADTLVRGYDTYTSSTYGNTNYSVFNALSINIPNDAASTRLNVVSFPFSTTDMTGANAAIRIRLQTLVRQTGRMNPRFDLVQGGTTTLLSNSAVVYKVKNGVAKSSTTGGNGIYVIDNGTSGDNEIGRLNGLFDGYIIIPISAYNVTASAVTGLNINANISYIKNIWNFGDIDFGTFDGSTFVKTASLWTTSDSYTLGAGIDAEIVSGTTSNVWIKSEFESVNNTIDISDFDGMKFYVDNSGGIVNKSIQVYMYSSELASSNCTPAYGWRTNYGLAYFTPDNDCEAFKSSFAYRSSFVPAGFKGYVYIPFSVNGDGIDEAGTFSPRENAPEDFPTSIYKSFMIYFNCVGGEMFGIRNMGFVADAAEYMESAFLKTSAVNLASTYSESIMVKSDERLHSQFELWPNSESGLTFASGNYSNEEILGGTSLGLFIENLNNSPFIFSVKTWNNSGDITLLGGNIIDGTIKFVSESGAITNLSMKNGYITIPAYAKGTLILPYVGALEITEAVGGSTTYALGYPAKNVYRLVFDAFDDTGDASYRLGKVAIINGDGTYNEIKISGTGISELAAASEDGTYKKERIYISYSGEMIALDALTLNNYYYAGASIRVVNDGKDGIRFTVRIEKEIYDILTEQKSDVVFGMLVIPEDMKGGELTINTAYVVNRTANHILTEETVNGKEYVSWTYYMYGVPKASWGRGFLSRGYILVDGKYYYTEESFARSINYVAQAVYNAYLAGDDTFADRIEQIMAYLPE